MRPVRVVTSAPTLTAFRIGSSPVESGRPAVARRTDVPREPTHDGSQKIALAIHKSLAEIEGEWRRFERICEGTPFQSFGWLSAWQRHIGTRQGIVPAIAVGRFADGGIAFIAPLAVEPKHSPRRLRWLGQDLCDYNAPLLAREFSQQVTSARFLAIWKDLQQRMQSDPELRFDWIDFEKMPQTIGVQINPFTHLGVVSNASSAHITLLGDDWETFYRAKRSSATRRRDRTKRKHMSKFGEIRCATVAEPNEVRQTLDILWEQKRRIFARKGIADIFALPGYREFFADFATNPDTRHLAHVGRMDAGDACAAANFAIVFGDCYYHVLSSYCDSELTRYGPGTLHLRELLAHAIGLGLRRFDFTIGDERYKLEWSDLRLKLHDYSAAATWRGRPAHALSTVRRRLKRFIKQTPLAWRIVCRVRSLVGPF